HRIAAVPPACIDSIASHRKVAGGEDEILRCGCASGCGCGHDMILVGCEPCKLLLRAMSIVLKRHKDPPAKRLRRTSAEARTLALESARKLLLAKGPDAITLQAVATDLGMSHTNLIHHFGSA